MHYTDKIQNYIYFSKYARGELILSKLITLMCMYIITFRTMYSDTFITFSVRFYNVAFTFIQRFCKYRKFFQWFLSSRACARSCLKTMD